MPKSAAPLPTPHPTGHERTADDARHDPGSSTRAFADSDDVCGEPHVFAGQLVGVVQDRQPVRGARRSARVLASTTATVLSNPVGPHAVPGEAADCYSTTSDHDRTGGTRRFTDISGEEGRLFGGQDVGGGEAGADLGGVDVPGDVVVAVGGEGEVDVGLAVADLRAALLDRVGAAVSGADGDFNDFLNLCVGQRGRWRYRCGIEVHPTQPFQEHRVVEGRVE